MRNGAGRGRRERGNSLVEFALVTPILFVLMLSIVDGGFYVYSFISVQYAARAAALRNSGGRESAADQASACSTAVEQLRGLPSINTISGGSCSGPPLLVASAYCDGPDPCGRASASADGSPAALVTVSYTLPSVFSFPLTGPSVISISSQMKLRDNQ